MGLNAKKVWCILCHWKQTYGSKTISSSRVRVKSKSWIKIVANTITPTLRKALSLGKFPLKTMENTHTRTRTHTINQSVPLHLNQNIIFLPCWKVRRLFECIQPDPRLWLYTWTHRSWASHDLVSTSSLQTPLWLDGSACKHVCHFYDDLQIMLGMWSTT